MTEEEFRIKEEVSQDPLSEIMVKLTGCKKIKVIEASDDYKRVATASCAYNLLDFVRDPVKKLSRMSFDRMGEQQCDQMDLSIMKIQREVATIDRILLDYIIQLDKTHSARRSPNDLHGHSLRGGVILHLPDYR